MVLSSATVLLALAAPLSAEGPVPVSVSVSVPVPVPVPSGTVDKRRYTVFDPTPDAALRDFTTDRPDATESPFTVDAGHFQIETSLVGYAFDRDGTSRSRTLDVSTLNLKLGLTNAVDIQFVFTPYRRVVTRDGGRRGVAAGFGDDTQVRLKVNLWGNDGGTTAFAVMPFVKAPTGAAGLGNGHVEGGVILPLAVELPADFSLGTMLELDLTYDGAGRGGRGDYGVDAVHSATLGHALVGALAGYVEYVGVAPRSGGGGYRATASTGVTYALSRTWNLDGGGTFGLSGRTDDITLFVGTSRRF